jgi:hypothetical protein
VSCTHVFKWFKGFREEFEDLEDDAWSGWQSTAWNPETVAESSDMVARYCWVTLKMMEDHMHIKCEMIPRMNQTDWADCAVIVGTSWWIAGSSRLHICPIHLTLHQPTVFLFLWSENWPQMKMISGCQGHQEVCNCQIRCISFECCQWLLCSLNIDIKVCCTEGRLLLKDRKQVCFYLMCVCSCRLYQNFIVWPCTLVEGV